jgi:hypothetical protein
MPNWYPGQVAVGQKVESAIFGMAKGFWSQPPAITTPGTPASSPGTVVNTTGFDCMVYLMTTGTVTAVSIGGVSLPGSALPNQTTDYYVPAGQTMIMTYGGTLTWKWLAV